MQYMWGFIYFTGIEALSILLVKKPEPDRVKIRSSGHRDERNLKKDCYKT